jgi:hypothetical protein
MNDLKLTEHCVASLGRKSPVNILYLRGSPPIFTNGVKLFQAMPIIVNFLKIKLSFKY